MWTLGHAVRVCVAAAVRVVGRRDPIRALPRGRSRRGSALPHGREPTPSRGRGGRARPSGTVGPHAHGVAQRASRGCDGTPPRRRRRWQSRSASPRWSRLYTTFELLHQDPAWEEPGQGWIVVSLLAVTLPLAVPTALPAARGARGHRRVRGRADSGQPGHPGPGRVGGHRHGLGRVGRAVHRGRARPAPRRHGRGGRRRRPGGHRRGRARDLLLRGRCLRRPAAQPGLPAGLQRRLDRAAGRARARRPRACATAASALPTQAASCGASARRTPAAPCSTSACGSHASSTTSSPTT